MKGDTHEGPEGHKPRGEFPAVAFGREVRRLVSDVQHVLGRPDDTPDELIGLHRRAYRLLRQVPLTRSDAVIGWLLEVRQEVGARLRAWAEEELGVRVA